ncbi:unnamed protein product [Cuscuta campestris]|uniref:Uncharacterized protein n=1 Tax=Cuscuta campestris TaxID=132261 RepID=A0A484NCM9_9ASTE|nr:unnamed protein product [Cuscuta campestris]
MDKAGPSRSRRSRSRRSRTQITPDGDVRSVHRKDEDWDVPQAQKKLKGKAIQPEGSRRSAFQRLGHEGRNQNRPAKERLGVETTPLSAFDRLGRGAERPGRTRRTEPPHREEPQHSRAPHGEEEAESHPRHTIRSHVEQPRDRVGRVEACLEKLQRWVDQDEKKKILLNESPFTDRVHETPFSKKAKLEVPKFTGKEDPEIHVKTLHQSGRMMGLSGDEKCLLFFQTLRGQAAEWFHNLPAGEIDSFDELAEVFQDKFKENCTKRKKFTYLSTAGQREHEDLTKFLNRWMDEVDKVEEMDDKTAMSLLVSGLRSGELYKEFCRRPPQSYQEAFNTAWDYADAEAQVSSKREAEQGHSKGRISLKKETELPGMVKTEVMEVKPVKSEKKPAGEKQCTEKYCSFHKTDSHNTVECNSVKGVIKQMIEAGEIDPEYLAQAKQKKNQWIRPEGQPVEQNKKKKAAGKENLQVIYGGPEGGDSASQRKKWGSVNVLYLDAFEKLKLCRTRLEPLKTPLSRFTGDSVEAEGSILLTCELGTGDEVVQKQMRFVVVNIKCVHNAILGRPGINKVRGVISMAHLCMKFYTPGGIGQVRGDQKKARSCYLEAVKKMTKAFERVSLVSQEEERSKLEPGDETEQIVLRETFLERMGHALADFLVELTNLEPESGPYHTVEPWWDMAVDGASGPKGCGAGIVFTTPEGFKIYHALVFNFKLTNNEAEYEALAGGLRLARALGIKRMRIRCDSSLVVGQVNGEMEVKEERLARYSDLIRALLRGLEEFRLTRIPRSENTDADILSKFMQACPEHVSKLAKIEILDVPSADRFEVAAIQPGQSSATGIIGADDDWRYDLMEYLETGQKRDDEERARKVVLRAPRFQVLDGHLYKRAIGGPLLRCLTNPEAERVIAEVHEGVCAAHQMSRTLAQRIILLGYYWPTIIGDCERYVQKCRTCQVFYKHPGRPATYYQPTSNVIPFARFGIDIIGAFPVAQGGKKFVMVAIDYFTKWIEAEAMATITVRQCEKFVWKNIITRFGAPKVIVTDNGPQFRNPRFTAYLANFGIKHSKASVAYPQGNGQVENANRTIVDGLKKRLGEEGHKWLEALPHTVWAHKVTSRRATGETPFVLTYGCEARLPVKAEIPTFRETVYQPGQNEVDHLAELNLVEERRTIAAVKMASYQQLVKRYHDNRVGPRYFQVHDEVLRRRDASKPNERGKLVRNWEGPNRIKAIIRPGTYQLETLEGGRVDRHWNSHHLRKFFK